MIVRRRDWQARLVEYLGGVEGVLPEPGVHDCCLCWAGAVEAMTGVDLAEPFRGYGSIDEGQARLRDAGYRDHVDLMGRSFERRGVLAARPGDLALVRSPEGPSVGLVQGVEVYVLVDGLGLGRVPLMDAVAIFAVPMPGEV